MSSQTDPSWCRITTGDSAEGTFRFTIENFKNRPEKCNESVKASSFKMKGPGNMETKWKVKIYPKGKEDGSGDYVGVTVINESKCKVKAQYKMNIIDVAEKERLRYGCKVKEYDPTGHHERWGKSKWFKREMLNNHPDLLPDGNLTIKCTITVFGPPKVLTGVDSHSTNPNLSVDCQKQLGEQLEKVFSEKRLTDVKIECQGGTFDCHKAILAARSPVFLAMFEANMKENETNIVNFDDFKARIVAEMLNFIYTGNISSEDTLSEIASELLAAADKYQLDLLKSICEEEFCSTLEATNCVEYLVLGDMYQTFKLKRMALRLIVENVDSITDTDVIKDLFRQKPELALEVMKAVKK